MGSSPIARSRRQGSRWTARPGVFHGTPQATGQYFFSVDISDGAGAPGHTRLQHRDLRGWGESAAQPAVRPEFRTAAARQLHQSVDCDWRSGALSLLPDAGSVTGSRHAGAGWTTAPDVLQQPGRLHRRVDRQRCVSHLDSRDRFYGRALRSSDHDDGVCRSRSCRWAHGPEGAVGTAVLVQPGSVWRRRSVSRTILNTFSPLPPGLSLNAVTGQISGTPTAAGSFFPTITLTDLGDVELGVAGVFAWPSIRSTSLRSYCRSASSAHSSASHSVRRGAVAHARSPRMPIWAA